MIHLNIKSNPKDFIVEEICVLPLDDKGRYSYYLLKKTNIETGNALQIIANTFKINKKYINIAGTKDKVAVTTQCISISNGPKKSFDKKDICLQYIGNGNKRLSLGMLDGNKFSIIIRSITEKEMLAFEKNKDLYCVPNYYDDQRFGIRKNNHIIGKHIIKKQFKEAVEEAVKQNHYPYNLLQRHLAKHPRDFIGALRAIPKRTVLMFIHAYQSYLWNETVKIILKKYIHRKVLYALGELYFPKEMLIFEKNKEVPIIGFDMECDDAEINEALQKIMKNESLAERDFIVAKMPELSAAGGKRLFFCNVTKVTYSKIDKETIKIVFTLKKGSYATVVIKALFV